MSVTFIFQFSSTEFLFAFLELCTVYESVRFKLITETMAFDRSTLAENDYTRGLSEKYERLLQEKNILEERKQKAHEICKCLFGINHKMKAFIII